MAFYNEIMNVWEPVIEPVERDGTYKSWDITVNVFISDLLAI